MKEETEKERLEQLEQEEIERQKQMSRSRRSSSPAMRHSIPQEADTREAKSEPIKHTPFVSLSKFYFQLV